MEPLNVTLIYFSVCVLWRWGASAGIGQIIIIIERQPAAREEATGLRSTGSFLRALRGEIERIQRNGVALCCWPNGRSMRSGSMEVGSDRIGQFNGSLAVITFACRTFIAQH